jgi:hypothetical protein
VVVTPKSTSHACVGVPDLTEVDDQYAVAVAAGKSRRLMHGAVVTPEAVARGMSWSDCSSFTFGSRQSLKPPVVSPSAYVSAPFQFCADEGTCVHIRPVSRSVTVPSLLFV